MIHLANQPTAGRPGLRTGETDAEDKAGASLAARRSRTGHAWPFPSRYTARPLRQDSQKPTASDSGS